MKTKEINELVDRYIRGELSADQKNELEEKIKSDEAFREAYALHRGIKKALLDEDMADFENLLKDISSEKNPSRTSSFPKRSYYAVAAAIVMLVGLGTLLYFQMNRKPLNERLFDQYYTSFQFDNFRSEQLSDLSKGYIYYKEKQYDSAVIFARKALKNREDEQTRFFAAVSLLADGRYAEATRFFNRLARSDNWILKEYAEWYQALALLRLNRIEEATLLLYKIKVLENDFSGKAAELLKKIQQWDE